MLLLIDKKHFTLPFWLFILALIYKMLGILLHASIFFNRFVSFSKSSYLSISRSLSGCIGKV